MSLNARQFIETFIAESNERLQEMETILLGLESGAHDDATIDALFRAAHTVKGSAGMLNLDPIVGFSHIVEDLLDRMRDREIDIDADLVALLLDSCDYMRHLVKIVAEEGKQLSDKDISRESALRKRLHAYQESSKNKSSNNTHITVAAEEEIPLTVVDGGEVNSDNWHISLRFATNVLKDGLDPLNLIRYLSKLGTVISITTLADAMPEIEDMDPELCYLGFEIDFKSDASKETIADVFEFAQEGSQIHILPPHSKTTEFIDLIRTLPEDETRVGEILLATGVLTQSELNDGLKSQKENSSPDGPPVPLGEVLIDQGSVTQEVVQAALEKQTQVKMENQTTRYLRVQADKLDELIDLVGELVIAGAGANMLAHSSSNIPLQEATSVVTRLVEEIRDSALNLRMVQIGETFNRFQRVVRDVGIELGKKIDLVISGAETELDKTLIEKIGDPLMHLVRNAIDHGIEPAEVRMAAGKPANGTLRLNAYHDSGSIAIEISDDGAGLNKEKILRKAKLQGLVPEGAHPSDQEIYNLIFEAGFSTADAVTNLSGRGVGMDVVKRNISSLRGMVQLESEPGLGTTVRIRLPLTLAIIDGFRVGVGKSSYVVPLDMVIECIELSEEQRKAAKERSYLNLRGEVLPFVVLRDHFEIEGANARRENVVVVQFAGHKAGLVVDELMGELQTVIKPLGKIFSNLRGISGSTILGSGEVALILDVPSLMQHAVSIEKQKASA